MDYLSLPLFSLMKSRLNYLSAEQKALARNIANADTPDYKAVDAKAPDFKRMAKAAANGPGQKLQMTRTNPMHMAGAASGSSQFKMEERKNTDELNPNGNNVAIEEEMEKMSDNQMAYQKVISMYGKTITMFKTAIGNTSGS